MISFSSGGENPHGVKAVTKGQRCAVALWFTLDPLYRELVSFWHMQKANQMPRWLASGTLEIMENTQQQKHFSSFYRIFSLWFLTLALLSKQEQVFLFRSIT